MIMRRNTQYPRFARLCRMSVAHNPRFRSFGRELLKPRKYPRCDFHLFSLYCRVTVDVLTELRLPAAGQGGGQPP